VGEVVEPHLGAVERLDPDALVGFRGSLARGFKSEQKDNLPFDVNNFDIDAFIVSDKLAASYPKNVDFRNGGRYGEIGAAQQTIDQSLRQFPEFSGLRSEPFTFRIYTQREIQRMQSNYDAQYYFLRNH
jgi:filamentous hemagglutinin